jgi:hypothetical protein
MLMNVTGNVYGYAQQVRLLHAETRSQVIILFLQIFGTQMHMLVVYHPSEIYTVLLNQGSLKCQKMIHWVNVASYISERIFFIYFVNLSKSNLISTIIVEI